MSVRLKFHCWDKQSYLDESYSIQMQPCYSDSPENKEFFKATPGGILSFSCVNPAAAAQIEKGKSYYIDITPAGD